MEGRISNDEINTLTRDLLILGNRQSAALELQNKKLRKGGVWNHRRFQTRTTRKLASCNS